MKNETNIDPGKKGVNLKEHESLRLLNTKSS